MLAGLTESRKVAQETGEQRTDLSGDYLRRVQDGYKWAEVGTSIGPCPVSIIDTTYVDPLQYG